MRPILTVLLLKNKIINIDIITSIIFQKILIVFGLYVIIINFVKDYFLLNQKKQVELLEQCCSLVYYYQLKKMC